MLESLQPLANKSKSTYFRECRTVSLQVFPLENGRQSQLRECHLALLSDVNVCAERRRRMRSYSIRRRYGRRIATKADFSTAVEPFLYVVCHLPYMLMQSTVVDGGTPSHIQHQHSHAFYVWSPEQPAHPVQAYHWRPTSFVDGLLVFTIVGDDSHQLTGGA